MKIPQIPLHDLHERIASYLNIKKEVDFVELMEPALEHLNVQLNKKRGRLDIFYPIQGLEAEPAERAKAKEACHLFEELLHKTADFIEILTEEGCVQCLEGRAVEMNLGLPASKRGLALFFDSPSSESVLLRFIDLHIVLLRPIE